jgi:uncharacterized membrane protein
MLHKEKEENKRTIFWWSSVFLWSGVLGCQMTFFLWSGILWSSVLGCQMTFFSKKMNLIKYDSYFLLLAAVIL